MVVQSWNVYLGVCTELVDVAVCREVADLNEAGLMEAEVDLLVVDHAVDREVHLEPSDVLDHSTVAVAVDRCQRVF